MFQLAEPGFKVPSSDSRACLNLAHSDFFFLGGGAANQSRSNYYKPIVSKHVRMECKIHSNWENGTWFYHFALSQAKRGSFPFSTDLLVLPVLCLRNPPLSYGNTEPGVSRP